MHFLHLSTAWNEFRKFLNSFDNDYYLLVFLRNVTAESNEINPKKPVAVVVVPVFANVLLFVATCFISWTFDFVASESVLLVKEFLLNSGSTDWTNALSLYDVGVLVDVILMLEAAWFVVTFLIIVYKLKWFVKNVNFPSL